MDIGKIERVALREVWPHEAHDFTTWLRDNLDILGDTIALELTGGESEQAAGDFSVDILAEDADANTVIIEDQLARSDHDHLGKLITYLSVIEARSAMWVVSQPRPEHVSAVTWLNESTSADFYLVKVEAIRIGASLPAPLLTLIVGPSEEARQAGTAKRELAERYHIRKDFWSQLLERAKQRTNLHANISPATQGWIGTGAGIGGLSLNYVIKQHVGRIELYIDRGKDSDEENKHIFDQLHANREEIEEAFGDSLGWQRLDNARASCIRKDITDHGYRDEEDWPAVQDAMIEAMIRFEAALRPHIDALEL